MEKKRLTRRQLGLTAVAAAPVLSAAQQTAAPAASEVESARADQLRASAALRRSKLPQLLEPSFTFHP